MSDVFSEARLHDELDELRAVPSNAVSFIALQSRIDRMEGRARRELLGVFRERLLREWRRGRFGIRDIPVRQIPAFALHVALAWLSRHRTTPANAFHRLTISISRPRFELTGAAAQSAILRPVSVVIPVYNGYEVLQRLCQTLFDHTDSSCGIVFVDDASPDGRIRPYLDRLAAQHANVTVVANERNLGFPGSVNAGAAACDGDFVILNTDTEVPAGWIPRLFAPIWSDPRVASAMPLTCEWPDCGIRNPGVISMDGLMRRGVPDVDRAVSCIVPDLRFCESSGNLGFCLAISRAVWDRVGPFAADVFGFGYHEEADWCARARYRFGYSHKIAANVFVAHWHNGSFSGERRKAQLARNKLRLLSRNPQREFDRNPYYAASRKAVFAAAKLALEGGARGNA